MWVGSVPQFVCAHGHDLCVTLYTTVCGDECVSTWVCSIHGLYVCVEECGLCMAVHSLVCMYIFVHMDIVCTRLSESSCMCM